MMFVDMGFLPYFDFGGHTIVVCGYHEASDTFLVADRDSKFHSVPAADLERARGSTFKPFLPKHQ